jgi:hypothetical protein
MKQLAKSEIEAISAAVEDVEPAKRVAAATVALASTAAFERNAAATENIAFCVTAALGLRPSTPHVRDYSQHYVNLWLANGNEDPVDFETEAE